MTAFLNHFTFEFKTGLRNPTSMLMNYLFPLVFYALMGLVMTQINPQFKNTMTPALVIFAIMVSTLLGMPGPMVESREAGIYRSYKINGVPALSVLIIPALTTIFHALIISGLIAVTATPFFDAQAPTDWGSFVVITLLSAFTFGAIGALISVISTSSRSVVLWSQLIFLPSMLLGGLMMPTDILPESVKILSGLLPTTYMMQAFLGFSYGQDVVIEPILSIAILFLGALLALGLAIYLFNWDRQNLARRGHPIMAALAWLPYLVGVFIMLNNV